jgi:histidyl-tRNA synthetase
MKTDTVKGFKDFTGEEAEKKAEIKKILVSTFEKYGFEPAETPLVEYGEFVKGNNSQDEAISDVFKLKDKGKRDLALRYEFTFQLKRLIKNKKLPYKRYQIGPVFRDEPTSKDKERLRQFTQCDVDVIGLSNLGFREEAEILFIVKEIFEKLGIKPIILINNRRLLNEILEKNKIKEKDKEKVLREIDKIDKLPEKQVRKNLKKLKAEKVLTDLKKNESFFKKFSSYNEILKLVKYCRYYGVEVLFSPNVVRGLSYYKGNVFEVKSKGIKETLVAGGTYEINEIKSTGISFGLERLAILSKIKSKTDKILVISLEQDKEAIKLATKLRNQGKRVVIYYGKPSKALEYANSYGFLEVIFIGKDEIKKGKFKVKNMKTGKESLKKF